MRTATAFRRIFVLARHDLRLLRSDAAPLLVGALAPLLLIVLLDQTFASLTDDGRGGIRRGAEQLVPGMTVLGLFFLVGNLGVTVYREHGWNTWDRLRATVLTPAEAIAGRAVTPFVFGTCYVLVLISAGGLLVGLDIEGPPAALFPVAAAIASCMTTFGLALVSLCRSVMQFNVAANLLGFVFSAAGGALTPVELLPAWLQHLAPATPTYWAMNSLHAVIAGEDVWSRVAKGVAVMLLLTVFFGAVAAVRFRFDERKVSWA